MPSEWNNFVKSVYQEGKAKNGGYSFSQALKDASKRKHEMTGGNAEGEPKVDTQETPLSGGEAEKESSIEAPKSSEQFGGKPKRGKKSSKKSAKRGKKSAKGTKKSMK